MNETNTNQVTCQDPTLEVKAFSFSVLPQFVEDLPLSEPAPSRHQFMKRSVEQTPDNCTWPGYCGNGFLKGKNGNCIENVAQAFCHKHSCPMWRAELARRYGRWLSRWQKRFWCEVADGTKYRTLRTRLTRQGLQFFGIPTDHGTVLVITPESVDGSVPYTGGWYHFAALIAAMPPEERVRRPQQQGHKEHDEEEAEEEIAVNASESKPAVCPVEPEEEKMQGIPLVPRDSGKRYALHQWTEVEQAYLFAQAGFKVDLGTYGGVRIYCRDPYEASQVENMLSDLAHAESQLVQQTREKVMQELRSPEPAEWKEVARQIQEHDQRARKYDQ